MACVVYNGYGIRCFVQINMITRKQLQCSVHPHKVVPALSRPRPIRWFFLLIFKHFLRMYNLEQLLKTNVQGAKPNI